MYLLLLILRKHLSGYNQLKSTPKPRATNDESQKSAKLKHNMVTLLQMTLVVGVTADLWSSRQFRSYFSITIHLIVNWTFKLSMLSCSCFHGSHTAESVGEELKKTMDSFQISSKVSVIITDSSRHFQSSFFVSFFRTLVEL